MAYVAKLNAHRVATVAGRVASFGLGAHTDRRRAASAVANRTTQCTRQRWRGRAAALAEASELCSNMSPAPSCYRRAHLKSDTPMRSEPLQNCAPPQSTKAQKIHTILIAEPEPKTAGGATGIITFLGPKSGPDSASIFGAETAKNWQQNPEIQVKR